MSTAASSSSRGEAGVRATTGLFSIFTLLCLVYLLSTLMHKGLPEEFKEELQQIQERLDEEKVMYERVAGALKDVLVANQSFMELLEADVKAKQEEFPEHSLLLQAFLKGNKYCVEATKNSVNKGDEETRARIDHIEKKLERLRKSITEL